MNGTLSGENRETFFLERTREKVPRGGDFSNETMKMLEKEISKA